MARILLIEDEPDTSYALTAVLCGAGHDVDTADGVGSALERLADQPYDLMVCDLQLAHNQASVVLAAAQTADLGAVAISGGGLAAAADKLRQEKAVTTPDNYPLSVNALINACNQSTNRDPIVSYDESTVERVLVGVPGPAWQGENRRAAPRGPMPSA